jgi:hypothetical protein
VYHALTGRPPFAGETVWDVIARKRDTPPRAGPLASAGSADLVAAMMAPDPAARVGTYEELLDRIGRLPALGGPGSAAPRRPGGRSRGRLLWAAAVGGLAVAGVVAGVGRGVRPESRVDGPTPPVRYVSGGRHQPLFDGARGWLPPSAGGVWKVEDDDEGVPVLAGVGFARRAFDRSADYRVTIGLDVHRAAAAEVHFALSAKAPDASPRLVLRVTRAGGAVFGTRDADRGEFRPLGGSVPFPPPGWFEDRRPYLEVRFRRAGGTWAAWFNGAEAGRAADDGAAKAAEVRLFAEGGPARVDSAVLEELKPAKD